MGFALYSLAVWMTDVDVGDVSAPLGAKEHEVVPMEARLSARSTMLLFSEAPAIRKSCVSSCSFLHVPNGLIESRVGLHLIL